MSIRKLSKTRFLPNHPEISWYQFLFRSHRTPQVGRSPVRTTEHRSDESVGSCRIKTDPVAKHQLGQVGLPLPDHQQSEESSDGRCYLVRILWKIKQQAYLGQKSNQKRHHEKSPYEKSPNNKSPTVGKYLNSSLH